MLNTWSERAARKLPRPRVGGALEDRLRRCEDESRGVDMTYDLLWNLLICRRSFVSLSFLT